MSFFSVSLSLSPHRSMYRHGHYGSRHYQRRGMLDGLLDAFISRSDRPYYDPYAQPPYPPQQPPYPPQPYAGQQPYPQAPPQGQPHAAALPCPSCGAQVPAGSKFCLNCGKQMVNNQVSGNAAANPAFCPNCGDGLLPNARFCKKCGIKLHEA